MHSIYKAVIFYHVLVFFSQKLVADIHLQAFQKQTKFAIPKTRGAKGLGCVEKCIVLTLIYETYQRPTLL